MRASDGKLMWRYREAANSTANVATPVYSDGKVFYTSAYGTGGALLALQASGGEVQRRARSTSRATCRTTTAASCCVNGYLYGFNNAILTCLEFATGKVMWRDRSVGKGAVSYADGHLYILSENNVVGLVEATSAGVPREGTVRHSRSGVAELGASGRSAGGRLYIRNQGTLSSYDVRAR